MNAFVQEWSARHPFEISSEDLSDPLFHQAAAEMGAVFGEAHTQTLLGQRSSGEGFKLRAPAAAETLGATEARERPAPEGQPPPSAAASSVPVKRCCRPSCGAQKDALGGEEMKKCGTCCPSGKSRAITARRVANRKTGQGIGRRFMSCTRLDRSPARLAKTGQPESQ